MREEIINIEKKYLEFATICQCKEKLNPNEIAELILNNEKIITFKDTEDIYAYNEKTGLYEEAETKIKSTIQFLCSQKTNNYIVNETIASLKRRTYVDRKILEANPNLIPLENGVYDIISKNLLNYSPDFIFLTKHPIFFKKPEFYTINWENPIDKFLFEITENQENIILLKEIIGYCFYRNTPFQNFFIFVGSGANGKTVLLNIIRAMLGEENVSNHTLQDLTEDRFAKADLFGKNANISGDLPKKAFKDVGILKQITGGDTIMAQQKFKKSFSFKPYCKLIASCNEVPETPDLTEGFFRRVIIINFPNNFEGKENRNLTQELCTKENLSDFFNTCIDAFYTAMVDNKFIINETTNEKKEKYLNYSNSAVAFCNCRLEYDPDSELSTEIIYNTYLDFCKERKIPAKDNRHFFQTLYSFFNNRAYKKRKANGLVREYYIVGVDWK